MKGSYNKSFYHVYYYDITGTHVIELLAESISEAVGIVHETHLKEGVIASDYMAIRV